MTQSTFCPACHGPTKSYFTLRENDLKARRCHHCKAVIVSNTPISEDNISEFYSLAAYEGKRDLQDTDLYSGYYNNCFMDYRDNDVTIQQFFGLLDNTEKLVISNQDPLKLLDIGCATGVLLDIARKRGCDVFGVEVSPELSAYARDNFELDVSTDLFNANYPSEYFDIITLTDVIEHLPEITLPKMSIEIARVLQPGGVLVVRTPVEESMLRNLAKVLFFGTNHVVEGPMHLFYSFEHIINFTHKSLDIVFENVGLECVLTERQEENPVRLNLGWALTFVLKLSFLLSSLLRRQHKVVKYYRRP